MFAKLHLIEKSCHCSLVGRTYTARGQGHFLSKPAKQTYSRKFGSSPTVSVMGFFSKIFGNGESTTGSKEDTLAWARRAKPTCDPAPSAAPPGQQLGTFAGGCFWGLELAYQRVPGVIKTSVGYTGGHDPCPTYNSVCGGSTGHTEAVQVVYDPSEVNYERLLDTFFAHVDPTTKNRQGNDVGTQYRSAIFYHTPEQKAEAEKAFEEVNEKLANRAFRPVRGDKVVVELKEAGLYYVAEKYHQQYLAKGGRMGRGQSAEKGCTDKIRCYG
ncbi:PMSR-domain-containing protein [Coccomyxa subellipsoidea C-169]|uniref:peptide-methionine (S)-S-oxide reductase n=1 Tax=Coccomyxa subellipsoidea (strain C-169) TaxID=574566 RepID=I0YP20_COCSC|nr:PMSR-domain-containing protein [Coccomyxa subellipsoidea C-169]EIE20139.1 PMSR-domain-containing protein [Coccomyxa subellipsoidea C-169]|eukprot:XP_005644683.1 PMSR-domain-containing protein [Coccomyxa subellipsoidea C-169]